MQSVNKKIFAEKSLEQWKEFLKDINKSTGMHLVNLTEDMALTPKDEKDIQ